MIPLGGIVTYRVVLKLDAGGRPSYYPVTTLSLTIKCPPSRTAKSTISRIKVATPSGSLVTLPEGTVVTLE